VSSAHVVGSTDLEDGAPHWYTIPYNLKYDAKWTHFPNSAVEMNGADEVVVSGSGEFEGKLYGMRFATSLEWDKFINGHTVKVTLITRSSTDEPMKFSPIPKIRGGEIQMMAREFQECAHLSYLLLKMQRKVK